MHDTTLYLCTTYFHAGAVAIHNSFAERTWPVHINDLNCTGSERSWQDCPQNAFNPNLCNYRHDAAVSCQPNNSNNNIIS